MQALVSILNPNLKRDSELTIMSKTLQQFERVIQPLNFNNYAQFTAVTHDLTGLIPVKKRAISVKINLTKT